MSARTSSRTARPVAATRRHLPRSILTAVANSRILGIRADAQPDHRFTGVWAVLVEGRVFARSWTVKPDGWHRTFLQDPRGTLQVDGRQVQIRAVHARSERIRDAVERAYALKYSTPGARKYVRGFRTPRRRETTMEFLPRGRGR